MKTPRIYYGAFAVFCIFALVIGMAGAATTTQQVSGNNLKVKGGQFGPEKMILTLDNLTAKGYDVSAIRTATTSGDYKTAQTLMQEFRTAHPDLFPAHTQGAGKVQMTDQAKGDKMLLMLGNLTTKGYDVSASTAVTSGDYKTAMTLMQEFRTSHPDVFPAHVQKAGNGNLSWQRGAQNNP